MRSIAISVAAVGLAISACTVEAERSAIPTTGKSAGVMTSKELFDLFADTCLTHFPDGKSTKAAFRRAGLKTIQRDKVYASYGHELGTFEDVDRRVSGGFGPIVYELAEGYDGGPLTRATCSVKAEIVDQDRDWVPLVASLPTRFPMLDWTSVDALQASFKHDGAVFDVLVEPHEPGWTWEDATPRCSKADCGDWEEAVLTVGITK